MQGLDRIETRKLARAALDEDVGAGDVTTLATIPATLVCEAVMRAREAFVVAGMPLAEAVFLEEGAGLQLARSASDGDRVGPGEALLRISGSARAILTAERTALNFVQRLSGIATLTSRFVAETAGTGTEILDTRKTTPGLRALEKYAVACGGGRNHRFGLFDQVLIKDNHLAALEQRDVSNAIEVAVLKARAEYPGLVVEVEADTIEQAVHAAAAGADIVLLDNMPPEMLREAVRLIAGRARIEASGGVTLETVRAIAVTGVDFISVGALTHSARAVDIGLDFESFKR